MTEEALQALLASIPYVGFLGMEASVDGGAVLARLPFREPLIGNTSLPAIHGGVIGAFLELTALAALSARVPGRGQARTIDVTIEYLRSGRPEATFAAAEVVKLGRRIANVRVEAWQSDRSKPIAALRGHFLLGET